MNYHIVEARHRIATVCVAILLSSIGSAQQPPATAARVTPGEFIVDPPTLINLGFEWFVDGDDNRNATVQVPRWSHRHRLHPPARSTH